MAPRPYPFIVMTGPRGAGKSTQIKRLEPDLKMHYPNIPILSTMANENGNAFCEGVREVVDDAQEQNTLAPIAELFAFCAIRAEHVARVLLPALREGNLVIQNRHIYDTYADLCAAREAVDPFDFKYFADRALSGLQVPDLIFYLDVDPEVGLTRSVKSGETKKIERSVLDYHMKVRSGYENFFDRWPEHKFIKLDSTHESEDQIFERIRERVHTYLFERLDLVPQR